MANTNGKYGGDYPKNRLIVIRRDEGICWMCGQQFEEKDCTADHLLPVSLGGTHDPDNMRAACGPCNSSRGAKDVIRNAWLDKTVLDHL